MFLYFKNYNFWKTKNYNAAPVPDMTAIQSQAFTNY